MEFIYKFIDVFKKDNQVLKKIDDKFVFDKLKIIIYRNQLISNNELNISKGLGSLSANFSYEEYEAFLKKTHSKIEKLIDNAITVTTGNKLTRRLLSVQKITSSGDLIQDIKSPF